MSSPRQSLVSDIGLALVMAAGYFSLCRVALSIDTTASVSSVWPASGVLTGLLLVVPRARWRAIAGGALIGGVAANLSIGFTAIPGVGYTIHHPRRVVPVRTADPALRP